MDSILTEDRVMNAELAQRVMSGEEAAALIQPGSKIGMSGFTGSGYPKAVPMALARRITDAHLRGQAFKVDIFTGASTGPELDGALAMVGGMQLRLPYQSDPITRKLINAGEMQYTDLHLSQVAQFVEYGFLGKMDLALIEVTAILEDGRVIPSTSIGNNQTWIDCAEKVILEVNSSQSMDLEGMHDLYYGLGLPPYRDPIPLTAPNQRILAQNCRKYPRLPGLGSEEGPHSGIAAAAAIRRGKHRQRCAVWAGGRPIPGHDRIYGSHPGRPGEFVAFGQAA